MKRIQCTFFMLHTVVRKYKTAEKYPCCENRRYLYAIILGCLLLFPSLFSLLSFNHYFVVLHKKLPSQLNTMRQDKICYNICTFSLLNDRLQCDLKNVRPGTKRMTVKFQHHFKINRRFWRLPSAARISTDVPRIDSPSQIKSPSEMPRQRDLCECERMWKNETWNIVERQQNTNDDDDKL